MTLEEQVTQAVARGWCHPENSHKVMDEALAFAIVAEVVKAFSPSPVADKPEPEERNRRGEANGAPGTSGYFSFSD